MNPVAFPEEDKLEYEVHEAHRKHEQAQAAVNVESRAAELLSRSAQAMERCLESMKEALSYSRYGGWCSPSRRISLLTRRSQICGVVEGKIRID